FFSSRRRHTRSKRDWSSDVCSSDLKQLRTERQQRGQHHARNRRPQADAPEAVRCSRAASRFNGLSAAHRPAQAQEQNPQRDQERSEERRVGKEGSDETVTKQNNITR